jgi:hypothetical protein
MDLNTGSGYAIDYQKSAKDEKELPSQEKIQPWMRIAYY